ncbi:GntR family transcriptional regulator [Prauserella muralis]|uniref:GntR family transcriptional regulator n=1 Tax=Prauserella muralis TaxID=588067 RepID=A0A2V4AT98_9PSEU|nr:GntR family transcriptional regulator [Prauserella muralis]PXY24646.1 GntR family transcriptional regulator [Prauserella muralis]TWE27666.1 GntR family transcriptional regulator [Prauserella muralis]
MRPNAVGGISGMQYSSKSDIVCAMLRELIISGEIAPSEPLRQRDLAARFGVSQTPVREALRRLESEGLVVNDPHRGATVRESRSGVVEDNAQIRAALESLGARLAARAITEEQVATLRRLNEQIKTLAEDDDERYATLNREFHFTIYESAASPMLLSMMRLLWQAMPAGPVVTRSHRESARQHDELVDALAARDAEQAAAITAKHILGTTHLESEIGHTEPAARASRSTRGRKKAGAGRA